MCPCLALRTRVLGGTRFPNLERFLAMLSCCWRLGGARGSLTALQSPGTAAKLDGNTKLPPAFPHPLAWLQNSLELMGKGAGRTYVSSPRQELRGSRALSLLL